MGTAFVEEFVGAAFCAATLDTEQMQSRINVAAARNRGESDLIFIEGYFLGITLDHTIAEPDSKTASAAYCLSEILRCDIYVALRNCRAGCLTQFANGS